ncbi:hypothetical protein ABDD95_19335 [Mucilaginibacter sp. PAMB04274]|uniref:hypothetical protein n=1 Tax=Mucilaginibacter sp. PAMB04274 TaxID=3138568 RepID=UPI0031F6B46A
MKLLITLTFFSWLNIGCCFAQRIVFDPKHYQSVIENGSVQSSAEVTHGHYLSQIDNNLQTINTNVGSVVLAQTIIYNGLANVNSALKNGLVVKDLAVIVSDILNYTDQTLNMARAEPYLLLFAESYANEIRGRATRLVTDVSGFVLKKDSNVLADYNARDQLLNHVRRELQIIDGMAYGAWKAMFWAKQRGIIASVNPYAAFINNDKVFVADIIRQAKYLKQ